MASTLAQPLRHGAIGPPPGAALGAWAFERDVEARLARLAGAGCCEVETHLDLLERFAPWLAGAGLAVPAAFIRTPVVTCRWQVWRDSPTVRAIPRFAAPPGDVTLDATIELALRHPSVRMVTIVLLLPEERETLDDYRRLADALNRAGEFCASAGLALGYHAHSFEFAPQEGTCGFDLLLARCDARLVRFEVDTFWFRLGGRDPVAFLHEHGARVGAVHLKDHSASAPSCFQESPWMASPGWRVPLGSGLLDTRRVLHAAAAAAVRHAFVEDESEGDRFENVVAGIRAAAALRR